MLPGLAFALLVLEVFAGLLLIVFSSVEALLVAAHAILALDELYFWRHLRALSWHTFLMACSLSALLVLARIAGI